MILFLSVKITDRYITYYDRGLLSRPERYKVFCYTLSSYSVIPWSAVRLYIEFDETQIQHKDFVLNYARRLFPEAVIKPHRLVFQEEWQAAVRDLSEMDDKLIFLTCNDDHPFIDSNLDAILALESYMRKISKEHPYVASVFSHWTELLPHDAVDQIAYQFYVDGEHLVIEGGVLDVTISIQIVTYEILESWFFKMDYGRRAFWRTDSIGIVKYAGILVVPLREICRHFDAYQHAGIDSSICPPLDIPDGFFEQNIRLQYGGTPAPRITLVDALNPDNAFLSEDGADWQTTLDEIPLFWRSAVSETRIIRPPTNKDKRSTEVMRLKIAAAASVSHCSLFHIYNLIGPPSGLCLTLTELATAQSSLNNSFITYARQRGLTVRRLNHRNHQIAVSVVIEDVGGHLARAHGRMDSAAKMQELDLLSLREAGVELVWITSPEIGGLMWLANTSASFSFDPYIFSPMLQPILWLEAVMRLALGDVILWLAPPCQIITRDVVLMFKKPEILEQLFIELYVRNNDIVKLQYSDDGVIKIIGIVSLRGSATRLINNQSDDQRKGRMAAERLRFESLSKTTAERLNDLRDLQLVQFEVNLTDYTLKPVKTVDAPMFIQPAMDDVSMDPRNCDNFQHISDSDWFAIMRLDSNNDANGLISLLLQQSRTHNWYNLRVGTRIPIMFSAMCKLLIEHRFASALILSFALSFFIAHRAVFFARCIGGLVLNRHEDEVWGLEELKKMPETSIKLHCDIFIIPILSNLLVDYIKKSDSKVLRVIEIVKAAVPRFRIIVDWELTVDDGVVYNCGRRLFPEHNESFAVTMMCDRFGETKNRTQLFSTLAKKDP